MILVWGPSVIGRGFSGHFLEGLIEGYFVGKAHHLCHGIYGEVPVSLIQQQGLGFFNSEFVDIGVKILAGDGIDGAGYLLF